MDRPQYSNAFFITCNSQVGEVVINFAHEFPASVEIPKLDAPGFASTQSTSARDDVCGVVIPASIAHQLADALEKVFQSNLNHE